MYKEQTDKMIADGGVMQQGGTKDEVSGNDVPVGSLKEEVRDDVDAKLSVGEFVVPADVVRYIGLENLMKMRDKAKAGLQKMSDIGQMGNAEEAKTPEDEEDVTEFSSAVDDVMGEEEADVKMAAGGYVQAENAKTYANAPLKGFEMVSLVNDAGNVIFIPYVNGKPQLSIPSGYKVKTGAVDTTAAAVTAPTGTPSTTGGMSSTPSEGGGGDGTPSAPASDSLPGTQSTPSVTPGMVSTLGAVIGGPIGAALSFGKNIASTTINDALHAMDVSVNQALAVSQLGLTPSEVATTVGQAAIASTIDSTPNMGEDVGTTATTGPAGTGSAAVAAASAAADAAAANGMSAAAIGAASQAAADAALGGASPSAAATAGGAAAAAAQGIADSVAANDAAIGVTGDVSGGGGTGPGVGTGSGIGGGDTGGVSGGGGDGSTGLA
jgi:hypothetical protein